MASDLGNSSTPPPVASMVAGTDPMTTGCRVGSRQFMAVWCAWRGLRSLIAPSVSSPCGLSDSIQWMFLARHIVWYPDTNANSTIAKLTQLQ
jgi:hypothetical protein